MGTSGENGFSCRYLFVNVRLSTFPQGGVAMLELGALSQRLEPLAAPLSTIIWPITKK
jgi:hypothetical protein